MSSFLNTLSAVGALVMAATPLMAVGSVAHAAETGVQPAHIRVADLDLSRAGDVKTFYRRVDVAAATFCARDGGSADLSTQTACRDAIRQEAVEKLGDSQRQAMQTASAGSPTTWRVAGN